MTEDAKAAARAVWGASPAGHSHGGGLEPGSRAYFERVREKRRDHELRFLKEFDPFAAAAGKTVLEVGCGAGYDAYEFCRAGADYSGLDITPENVVRARQHLAHFGFAPSLTQGDGEALDFADASFDMVFSNGVLHHTPGLERALAEACRVLKPGGHLFVTLYHRDSLFHWVSLWLFGYILRGRFFSEPFAATLARIEATDADVLPQVRVYSRAQTRRLLAAAGFALDRLAVRKLTWEDLPYSPKVSRLWPRLPDRLLDRLGHLVGWYLVAEAHKPGNS